MTYEVIEPAPDPREAVDEDDHTTKYGFHEAKTEAIEAFESARERIVEAVHGYAEVEDVDSKHVRVKAVVPFRVTAYRHDFDEDSVEAVRNEYGREPPGEPTDGFVEVTGSPLYRAIPLQFNRRFGAFRPQTEEDRDTVIAQSVEALESLVVKALEDGSIDVPITVTVQERRFVDEDGDVGAPVPTGGPFEDNDHINTVLVDYEASVGTASYKVDGIVPPEEWEVDQ